MLLSSLVAIVSFFDTKQYCKYLPDTFGIDCPSVAMLCITVFLLTMGLGPFGASAPLFLRNGELLGHSPIHNALACGSGIINIQSIKLFGPCGTLKVQRER
jgi:ABC-type tungstate transport system substrate-binding protein